MFKPFQKLRSKKAQSMLDYGITFTVATAMLFAFGPYMRRGIQGWVKSVADEIGTQKGAEQQVNYALGDGHLIRTQARTESDSLKDLDELSGSWTYRVDDHADIKTKTYLNLGTQFQVYGTVEKRMEFFYDDSYTK